MRTRFSVALWPPTGSARCNALAISELGDAGVELSLLARGASRADLLMLESVTASAPGPAFSLRSLRDLGRW
eukprot:2715166-Pleurochrysis_carterae.AAC.1